MKPNILVVDDEKEIADLIEVYLKNEDFSVHKYYSSQEAAKLVKAEPFDLAILDVMMPQIDGFALCTAIRENYTYPIIMLTAKTEEIDKITGLTLGADDYVTKPFKPLELVARVKAQLRRSTRYNQSGDSGDEGLISIGGLVLNKNTHECILDERKLNLTPTEFSILWILCERQGQVVSSDTLFSEVWGEKYYTSNNNTIMVHIRHLREKMHDSAENPKYIKTVWGVGYKIEK